jgi:hypothetical protein
MLPSSLKKCSSGPAREHRLFSVPYSYPIDQPMNSDSSDCGASDVRQRLQGGFGGGEVHPYAEVADRPGVELWTLSREYQAEIC